MTRSFTLSLKAGERIYINGAVLRVDRKVSLELLNDATFLLEGHILQVSDTTTPLRQLYFAVQMMLIEPQNAEKTLLVFHQLYANVFSAFSDETIRDGLQRVAALVEAGRIFEALRVIRGLFPSESAILAPSSEVPSHSEREAVTA
jgi:flagellar biosynthesis repressor protein FlbT